MSDSNCCVPEFVSVNNRILLNAIKKTLEDLKDAGLVKSFAMRKGGFFLVEPSYIEPTEEAATALGQVII